MSTLVEARNLGRFYGDVVGVSDVTVSIPTGVVGLLGPNGAGKSTFLKLLVGELRPSRGSIQVLGHEPFGNRDLYERLGFCPQQDALYAEMTGFEFVAFLTRLAGYSRSDAEVRAVRALERVSLSDAAHQKTRGYSKGMRQRVKIAQAIAHEPELIVLDEPMTGLDPIARRDVVRLFTELAGEGASIVLSSHVLHEVEALTKDIVLLHRGRLLAQGAVHEVRALLSSHPRKIEIKARESRRLARALLAVEGVSSVKLSRDGHVLLETSDIARFERDFAAIAVAERAGIESYEAIDAGLEAVFDYLVEASA
ncbi:MAG: ABC transporter ATP-binding protein [Planctomycetota bacterium]|mgnify:CR=1 FL=1|nr:ABC transporter ATP-binding protein [Planctomycetota bacterium]